MAVSFEMEQVYKIWNNMSGSRLEVGPDRDGTGAIQIASYDSDGDVLAEILICDEELPLLSAAIDALWKIRKAEMMNNG